MEPEKINKLFALIDGKVSIWRDGTVHIEQSNVRGKCGGLIFRWCSGNHDGDGSAFSNIVLGKIKEPLCWRQRSRLYFNTGCGDRD